MFTYFHAYHPQVWDAQVKAGLINDHAGIRFCQSKLIDDELKFNTLAAKDGVLHNILMDERLPLYIDRLQGGCYIDEYPYDFNLLFYYRELLGDRFIGFQMHEWASNFYNDIAKIKSNPQCDWSVEGIEKTIFEKYPFSHLFLESQTAAEFAQTGRIDTAEQFYRAAVDLYERRLRDYELLIPCDSYALTYKLALDRGARHFMPEVGAQTPNARLQISYAYSMAKAYHAEFGIYYEPWGGLPFSACCYHKMGTNEWGIGGKDFPFETKGENGGSSRSLQKRIHLYGYLSGASFISEEWGLCNTFYDWHDFALTPYGQVKKDFLSFVRRYPDVGEKIAPIALVLPKELDIYSISEEDTFCTYPLGEARRKELARIRKQVNAIFAASTGDMQGTEVQTLVNSDIPDAVDLIHEDSRGLEKYQYLVDLTSSQRIAKGYGNVCTVSELPALLQRTLPCYVEGGLHWMVNHAADAYYLAIFNHSGVCRSVDQGESVLPSAEKTVTVTLQGHRQLQMLEGEAAFVKVNSTYVITVASGDWFFGRF